MRNFVAALFIIFALLFWIGMFLPQDPKSSKEIQFLVQRGEGSREIAMRLQQEGLISSSPLFRLFVLTTGIADKLQAGTYLFSRAMSPFEISQKLVTGDVVKERITILEGWAVQDIANYLQERGLFSAADVLSYKDFEGYLFPDTYYMDKDTELKQLVQTMEENFHSKLTSELKEEIRRQGKTLSDIVIMASILERELQLKEDKEVAAGVLWKRIAIGMPLQVDASPITYGQQGLPEKPIANPGLESITAAIYPTDSPYLYYLSTPEGETIFSRTNDEHNITKARYLK